MRVESKRAGIMAMAFIMGKQNDLTKTSETGVGPLPEYVFRLKSVDGSGLALPRGQQPR